MTTRIVLEIYSDDEPFASEIRRIAALPEHDIERLTITAALHQFEAARVMRQIGAAEQYEATYARRRGPRKPKDPT